MEKYHLMKKKYICKDKTTKWCKYDNESKLKNLYVLKVLQVIEKSTNWIIFYILYILL